MVDILHFPLKSIMCQCLVSLLCLLANNFCIIKLTSNLSMYTIIYVLTHCAMNLNYHCCRFLPDKLFWNVYITLL
jgi:hypothetical protein